MLVRTKTNKRNSLSIIALCFAALVVAVAFLMFFMLRPAQGTGGASDTLGFGKVQSTQADYQVDTNDKFGVPDYDESSAINDKSASKGSSLARASQRSIVVKDPDPVVVYAAVDMSNAQTVAFAEANGTLNPLPTAPRLLPDVTGAGWQMGTASAYDLEDNEGWDATASGVLLNRGSITVAVPMSQGYLLGRTVQIVYGDKVIMATVTDVGGFAEMGRALDLGPGVWRTLCGGSVPGDWGVRTVHYKFM